MKHTRRLILLSFLLVALALSSSASALSPNDDKIVFGGNYTLASGDTLNGNLAVFGGNATLEAGSTVTGNVLLAGGTLTASGEIRGNVAAMGGSVFLNDGALVQGDLADLGATIHRSANARVEGQTITGTTGPGQFNIPGQVFTPRVFTDLHPITDVIWYLFRTLALAALAMLLMLFMPNPLNRTAQAAGIQPVLAGGLGLLTIVVAPIVLLLLVITILLIPVSLLGILVLVIAGVFGWIALGLEVGKRIAGMFKTEWPLAVAAGVGTFLLSLVANGIGFIPCVGWLAPFLVTIIGLGAVILTRFGIQDYPTAGTPVSGIPQTPIVIPPSSGANVPPSENVPPSPSGEQQ
ncbi:MAG: hypothetical protein M1281_16645 [Chloroflexi bacterium]|nr:hypothetical protein [Chloroflexota bacterium]